MSKSSIRFYNGLLLTSRRRAGVKNFSAGVIVEVELANFTHGHTLALDSKGNLYVAETNWGRRVQKFKIVDGQ